MPAMKLIAIGLCVAVAILIYFHQLIASIISAGTIDEISECHIDIAIHTFISHKKDVCYLDSVSGIASKFPDVPQQVNALLGDTTDQEMVELMLGSVVQSQNMTIDSTDISNLAKAIVDCKHSLSVLIDIYKALKAAEHSSEKCETEFPSISNAEESEIVQCFTDIVNSNLDHVQPMIHDIMQANLEKSGDLKAYFMEIEFLQVLIGQVEDYACSHKWITHFLIDRIHIV